MQHMRTCCCFSKQKDALLVAPRLKGWGKRFLLGEHLAPFPDLGRHFPLSFLVFSNADKKLVTRWVQVSFSSLYDQEQRNVFLQVPALNYVIKLNQSKLE